MGQVMVPSYGFIWNNTINMLAKYYFLVISAIFLQIFCDAEAMLFCKIKIDALLFLVEKWKHNLK